MRYVYSTLIVALMMFAFTSTATACDMRSEIRDEIRKELANLDVDLDIDLDGLEVRIHAAMHSRLDGEKDRLRDERNRVRDERRNLERERRNGRRQNNDGDDDDWGSSAVLALGLYGIGAFLLTRQSRRQNTD
ncbi:MAG: hypothetical protein VX603_00035 [Gemmatimonadota bacterium]|nr:hypothetical protein [Gemmatimonadota bacterium]